MKFEFHKGPAAKLSTDVIALFHYSDLSLQKHQRASLVSAFGRAAEAPLRSGNFKGKARETAVLFLDGSRVRRVLLVGLGERGKASLETYRRAAAVAAKRAEALHGRSVAFILPAFRSKPADGIVAFLEGAGLGLYRFDKYLTKKEDGDPRIDSVVLNSSDPAIARAAKSAITQAEAILAGTILARDLSNAPANEIFPETLAAAAVASGDRNGYSVKVLEEPQIKELKMGGVLTVSQGSSRPPRFIVLEYGPSSKRAVVLVGKGVTFDTGGISIKPSAGMAEMKMDMAGAAAVIGTFETVSRLKLPVHIVGLIPAVENMPSGSAVKPGDIVRHYNGKTSEVDNTDAEGRLILADALGYAETFKPSGVIDLATLTGAVVVALGHHATGMMGNDEKMMTGLKAAGERTYERVWQLPLFDEYEKQIKSDIADVKNVGGRWGGAITAGWFLKKFIGSYRWVHLDIAGTAIMEESTEYIPRGGSGVGVRLLTEFLRSRK